MLRMDAESAAWLRASACTSPFFTASMAALRLPTLLLATAISFSYFRFSARSISRTCFAALGLFFFSSCTAAASFLAMVAWMDALRLWPCSRRRSCSCSAPTTGPTSGLPSLPALSFSGIGTAAAAAGTATAAGALALCASRYAATCWKSGVLASFAARTAATTGSLLNSSLLRTSSCSSIGLCCLVMSTPSSRLSSWSSSSFVSCSCRAVMFAARVRTPACASRSFFKAALASFAPRVSFTTALSRATKAATEAPDSERAREPLGPSMAESAPATLSSFARRCSASCCSFTGAAGAGAAGAFVELAACAAAFGAGPARRAAPAAGAARRRRASAARSAAVMATALELRWGPR
mmetsp:Transcript_79476/g.257408  ORF Transcript_79476/g.257408 Transcript_79476/m.257408 type:complete len:353 (-) Transcript_79476:29-1087(-)